MKTVTCTNRNSKSKKNKNKRTFYKIGYIENILYVILQMFHASRTVQIPILKLMSKF